MELAREFGSERLVSIIYWRNAVAVSRNKCALLSHKLAQLLVKRSTRITRKFVFAPCIQK